eukprot:Pgem_evm2s165
MYILIILRVFWLLASFLITFVGWFVKFFSELSEKLNITQLSKWGKLLKSSADQAGLSTTKTMHEELSLKKTNFQFLNFLEWCFCLKVSKSNFFHFYVVGFTGSFSTLLYCLQMDFESSCTVYKEYPKTGVTQLSCLLSLLLLSIQRIPGIKSQNVRNVLGSMTAGVISGYLSHVPHNLSTLKLMSPQKSYGELMQGLADQSAKRVPWFLPESIKPSVAFGEKSVKDNMGETLLQRLREIRDLPHHHVKTVDEHGNVLNSEQVFNLRKRPADRNEPIESRIQALKESSMFRHCSEDTLRKMAEELYVVEYKKGEELM